MKLTFDTLGFDFEFEPSKAYSPRGELTATTKDQSFGQSIDLKAAKSRNEFADEFALLYPDELDDVLELKRALGELYLHVKDELAIAKLKAEEADEEKSEEAPVEEGDEDHEDHDEIEELVGTPGVLSRYVEAMAQAGAVEGDRAYLRVVALGAMSAQLAVNANGPLGTHIVLSGAPSRGKNYISDAVALGLPKSWLYTFDSASAKSFYYKAEANPQIFKHTWAYPGEAEATDQLVETLRPLLSKGGATHDTVDTNDDGKNTSRELVIEGPITITIPTVRNTLDHQLQTRHLTVEMADYAGRVKAHTQKYSDSLAPDYVAGEHASVLKSWKAALSALTDIRRVVLPGRVEGFSYNNDEVGHGSRIWQNLLSLMLTHAWLEQRTRDTVTLDNDENAIVVDAYDYKVAYDIFKEVAGRTVQNLSKAHRKICNALYALHEEKKEKSSRLLGKGFSMREVAKKAGISPDTVSQQKTYLVTSAKLLREAEAGGLLLVEGAEPSWWDDSQLMRGLPNPEYVKELFEDAKNKNRTVSPKPPDTPDSKDAKTQTPIDTANTEDVVPDRQPDTCRTKPGTVRQVSGVSPGETPSENGIDKPNAYGSDELSGLSGTSKGSEEEDTFKVVENRKGETELGSYRTL